MQKSNPCKYCNPLEGADTLCTGCHTVKRRVQEGYVQKYTPQRLIELYAKKSSVYDRINALSKRFDRLSHRIDRHKGTYAHMYAHHLKQNKKGFYSLSMGLDDGSRIIAGKIKFFNDSHWNLYNFFRDKKDDLETAKEIILKKFDMHIDVDFLSNRLTKQINLAALK